MEINTPTAPFNDTLDLSRNNPDRKTWGKDNSSERLHLGSEYDVTVGTQPEASVQPPNPAPGPPADEFPFKHKLSNGTELKAKTQDELYALIETELSKKVETVVELKFDDEPLYKPIEFKRKELTVQQQADLLNVWKENPQKALRMLEEAEYGVPMDALLQHLTRAEQRELERRQMEAGVEFLGECEDYNPTTANGAKLTEYLKKENKPITKNNLMVAFRKLSETDPALIKKVDAPPPAVEDETEELQPPVVVPSNQGRPENPASPQIDPVKFASLSLAEQAKLLTRVRHA